MALVPPLGREFPPEPVNCPLAAPRELDVVGGTICPAPEEEASRWGLGLDSGSEGGTEGGS